MNKPTVTGKEPISLAELAEEMETISERDEELNYRAGKTEEYVNEFTELSKEDYDELAEEIRDLDVPRLKEKHVIKILDFLPETAEDLDVVLEGYPLTLSDESKEDIIDVVGDAA